MEKDDGESIQVKVNRDGLFAVIYDGKYRDVTMISGADKEGKKISQMNFLR